MMMMMIIVNLGWNHQLETDIYKYIYIHTYAKHLFYFA